MSNNEENVLNALSYEQLKEELEQIVHKLNGGGVNIDDITTLVRRARTIVVECQKRLQATKEEVDLILSELRD